MSRLSVFATAAVLAALATTPVAFAKARHHNHKLSQYTSSVRPSQGYAIPGWTYAAPRPSVHNHDTPSYNDPSKFGGNQAL
jgi:hypothetical protein